MRCRAGLSASCEATADHRSLADVVEPRGATATEVNRGVVSWRPMECRSVRPPDDYPACSGLVVCLFAEPDGPAKRSGAWGPALDIARGALRRVEGASDGD